MRILTLVSLLLLSCHAAERPVTVREAEVRIVVDDTAATLSSVIEAVEAAGGHVVQSDAWREDGTLRARVILQVPSHELMRTLARIRTAASSVEHEHVRSANAPNGAPHGASTGAPAAGRPLRRRPAGVQMGRSSVPAERGRVAPGV